MISSTKQVVIERCGLRARIVGAGPLQSLCEAFATPSGAFGRASLLDLSDGSFPVGLLGDVRKILDSRGIAAQVKEPDEPAPGPHAFEMRGVTLHPYQQEALEHALKEPCCLIELPCGSGKTIVALAWVAALGIDALVICHRSALARQWARFVETHLGVEAGLVAAGERRVGRVTVACLPSLVSKGFDVTSLPGDLAIVFDEAHHAASPRAFRLLDGLACSRRLGLSGTPRRRDRTENMLVRSLFGPPVRVRDIGRLAREGHSASIEVRVAPVGGPALPLSGSWKEISTAQQEHAGRNAAIVRETARLASEGRVVLVIVSSVAHGERLAALLREREGVDAPFLSARDSVARREQVLDELRRGERLALVASDWVQEGTDVPGLGAVVLACGMYSPVATIQRVGRALRAGGGASTGEGIVVDLDDRSLHPLLGEHLERRVAIYRNRLQARVLAARRTGR